MIGQRPLKEILLATREIASPRIRVSFEESLPSKPSEIRLKPFF